MCSFGNPEFILPLLVLVPITENFTPFVYVVCQIEQKLTHGSHFLLFEHSFLLYLILNCFYAKCFHVEAILLGLSFTAQIMSSTYHSNSICTSKIFPNNISFFVLLFTYLLILYLIPVFRFFAKISSGEEHFDKLHSDSTSY